MSLKLPGLLSQLARSPLCRVTGQVPGRTLPQRFFTSTTQNSSSSSSIRIPSFLSRQPFKSTLGATSLAPSTPRTQLTINRGPMSFLRSFSTTRNSLIRSTYFPRNNGGSSAGGGPRRPGFFRRMALYIDGLPSMYIVSPKCHPNNDTAIPPDLQHLFLNEMSGQWREFETDMTDLRSPGGQYLNLPIMGIRPSFISAIP